MPGIVNAVNLNLKIVVGIKKASNDATTLTMGNSSESRFMDLFSSQLQSDQLKPLEKKAKNPKIMTIYATRK